MYPKETTNPDGEPSVVSFVGCRERCPETCNNNGQWTYISEKSGVHEKNPNISLKGEKGMEADSLDVA